MSDWSSDVCSSDLGGDEMLKKLTAPDDFGWAERTITAAMTTRTGMGFDVHAFGEGASVWLCGVQIPHSRGLVGHSDADVGLHALTDALLGAVGEGDIGTHRSEEHTSELPSLMRTSYAVFC